MHKFFRGAFLFFVFGTFMSCSQTSDLQDGCYRAAGLNMSETYELEVVVKRHRIASINLLTFVPGYQYAAEKVAGDIIKRQSTDVDAVTGATIISDAVKSAVSDALSMASKGKNDSEMDLRFNPGLYSTEIKGYKGTMKVEVEFSEDGITNINVPVSNETPHIGDYAINEMKRRIIAANGLGVDAVSGATITSLAVKTAVNQCAKDAHIQNKYRFLTNSLPSKEGECIEDTWDIVIIGAGGAGLSAAAQASKDGNSVLVIEKNATAGGNTLVSGGYYQAIDRKQVWDPEHPSSTVYVGEDGKTHDKVRATIGGIETLKVIEKWSEDSFDAAYYKTHSFLAGDINELSKHGVHSEYLTVLRHLKDEIRSYLSYAEPLLKRGKREDELILFSTPSLHIFQTYYGGLRMNDDRSSWIYGEYPFVAQFVEKGMELKPWLLSLGVEFTDGQITLPGALWNRCNIINGCNVDNDGDGNPEHYSGNWGTYVMAPMNYMLQKDAHNKIFFSTSAESLIVDDGKVTGVEALMQDGTKVIAHSRKAVIIASGGYAANISKVLETNQYWSNQFLTSHTGTTNRSSMTGDGISMAQNMGADVIGEGWPQLLPFAYAFDGSIAFGGIEKAVLISLRNGKRFVDECLERDVISQACFDNGIEFYGKQGVFLYFSGGYEKGDAGMEAFVEDTPNKEWGRKGSQLDGFFKEIGLDIDAEAVKQTIRQYDLAVMEGRQPQDFPKSHPTGIIGSAGKLANGQYDIASYDLENADLRIRLLAPSLHYTMGGLRTDLQRHVLDKQGNPIPGLYAAGEVTGGVFGGNRLGGNALTEVMVAGRIAAQEAGKSFCLE